jgi:hypothetical protein
MTILRITCAVLFAAAPLAAQARPTTNPSDAYRVGEFIVKTVPLRHLTSSEAVKLLQPYVESAGGGVYEVSANVRAVTIREMMKPYAQMMQVLAQYDREPTAITLNFQLIAAENTTTRDPAVAGLDSLLRGVLKFSGYRLLSTSVANASEHGTVSQTLSADGDPMSLYVDVREVRLDATSASVSLAVVLRKLAIPSRGLISSDVLSTGVTVPLGQTVVLGTSAMDNGQRALILTVRPQLAATPVKKD